MMNLKNGQDIAIYLRNAFLAISEISKEHGITIDARTTDDGYIDVRFGDYDYCKIEGKESFNYWPRGIIEKWRKVSPDEIVLRKEESERTSHADAD